MSCTRYTIVTAMY